MFKKKTQRPEMPLNTVLRLSKELGAERISKDAAILISEYLVGELEEIVKSADKFARHAERKTVMKDDVKLAIENR